VSEIDLAQIRALTFDCYGTLIDWEAGLSSILNAWAQSVGVSLRDDDLLEIYGQHEAALEAEFPALSYSDIVREAMRRIGRELNAPASTEWIERLGSSVGEWPAFPDSAESLILLHNRFKLGILSNVDHASFAGSARKLMVDFDLVVTAQDVGRYKPAAANFEALLERLRDTLGIGRDEILHVAQSLFHDHVPAQRLGLKTVWINRRHRRSGHGSTPAPHPEARFDAVFNSMRELARWAIQPRA
jgi:2-haloalkanoic acid dehalogenase type II